MTRERERGRKEKEKCNLAVSALVSKTSHYLQQQHIGPYIVWLQFISLPPAIPTLKYLMGQAHLHTLSCCQALLCDIFLVNLSTFTLTPHKDISFTDRGTVCTSLRGTVPVYTYRPSKCKRHPFPFCQCFSLEGKFTRTALSRKASPFSQAVFSFLSVLKTFLTRHTCLITKLLVHFR